jgi:hypothetical protein
LPPEAPQKTQIDRIWAKTDLPPFAMVKPVSYQSIVNSYLMKRSKGKKSEIV